MAKKMLKRDWEGRYVRLRRKMTTKGGHTFEKGEVMLVDRNYGGLHLSSVIRCAHCARRHNYQIIKVPEGDVVLLPEDYKSPSARELINESLPNLLMEV